MNFMFRIMISKDFLQTDELTTFFTSQTIPPSIGLLRNLRALNADENFLESIPTEVSVKDLLYFCGNSKFPLLI